MKDVPYWLDIPYIPRKALTENIETDVVVVGGGITGVSAAYHCAKAGFKTVLIEKETIASGSAGRNAGMVVDGLAVDFNEAVEQFGPEEARELWMNTVKSREHVISLMNEHNIDCDFTQPGSLYIGFDADDTEGLQKEASARKNESIECEILKKGEQFTKSPFGTALFNREDCILHPVKFIRGLAKAAEKYGATIYEHTPALKWDAHSVTTSGGIVTAKKVVLALESIDPYIVEREVEMIRSQALVTESLSNEKITSLDWNMGGMFWTAGDDYISCRKIGNRLLSCRGLSVSATTEEFKQNREWQIDKLLSFFPTLTKEDLVLSHAWSGLMVHTNNSRPYVREQGGCFEICGQGGNGLTNGIMCGRLIADFFGGREIPDIYRC